MTWFEGAPSGQSWDNWSIKKKIITIIDKMYFMYEIHDLIKILQKEKTKKKKKKTK